MTPEEIAKQFLNRTDLWDDQEVEAALADLIRDAYERAAQVAEAQAGGHYMAKICAAAIRTLKDTA